MNANDSSRPGLRTRKFTRAVAVLGCSLGVNLAPMLNAAEPGHAGATTAVTQKSGASEETLRQLQQIKAQIAAEQHKIDADQKNLTAFQQKLSADQLKLSANQGKFNALKQQLAADQLKLNASQQKLAALQLKLQTAK